LIEYIFLEETKTKKKVNPLVRFTFAFHDSELD